MPILTYGLEVLLPSEKELKDATSFHENTLRYLMSLTTNCARPAIYILSGQTPLIGQVHRKALTLFGSIITQPESIEAKIAKRQLLMKNGKDKSWFLRIKKILVQYDLPDPLQLADNPPKKVDWAKMVNRNCSAHWESEIKKNGLERNSIS